MPIEMAVNDANEIVDEVVYEYESMDEEGDQNAEPLEIA